MPTLEDLRAALVDGEQYAGDPAAVLHRVEQRRQTKAVHATPPSSRRKWGLTGLVASVAAAAVAVVVTLTTTGSTSIPTSTASGGNTASGNNTLTTSAPTLSGTQEGNSIQLAGYKITLPADYKVGKVDTNCTSDLHLSADEQSRLITTPSGGCPFLVTSVRRDLPPGAINTPSVICFKDTDDIAVASVPGMYAVKGPWDPATGSGENFVAAKLPDGSTVYITLDLFNTPPDKAIPVDSAVVKALSCDTLPTQVAELAKGMEVTPAP